MEHGKKKKSENDYFKGFKKPNPRPPVEKSINGEKMFMCRVCKDNFADIQQLTNHITLVHKKKPKLPQNDFDFKKPLSPGPLKPQSHKVKMWTPAYRPKEPRDPSNEPSNKIDPSKPNKSGNLPFYMCRECGDNFPTNEKLTEHMSSEHQGENNENNIDNSKDDSMGTIGKSGALPGFWGNRRGAKSAQKTTPENPDNLYMCRVCQDSFDSIDKLTKHISEFHEVGTRLDNLMLENQLQEPDNGVFEDKDGFHCKPCGKNTILKDTMDRHVQTQAHLNKLEELQNPNRSMVKQIVHGLINNLPINLPNSIESNPLNSNNSLNSTIPQNSTNPFNTTNPLNSPNPLNSKNPLNSPNPLNSQNSLSTTNPLNSTPIDSDGPLNQKRFQCPHCDKRFAQKVHLKKHVMTKHVDNFATTDFDKILPTHKVVIKSVGQKRSSNVPRFPCPYCDSKFTQKWPLKKHVEVKHVKEFPTTNFKKIQPIAPINEDSDSDDDENINQTPLYQASGNNVPIDPNAPIDLSKSGKNDPKTIAFLNPIDLSKSGKSNPETIKFLNPAGIQNSSNPLDLSKSGKNDPKTMAYLNPSKIQNNPQSMDLSKSGKIDPKPSSNLNPNNGNFNISIPANSGKPSMSYCSSCCMYFTSEWHLDKHKTSEVHLKKIEAINSKPHVVHFAFKAPQKVEITSVNNDKIETLQQLQQAFEKSHKCDSCNTTYVSFWALEQHKKTEIHLNNLKASEPKTKVHQMGVSEVLAKALASLPSQSSDTNVGKSNISVPPSVENPKNQQNGENTNLGSSFIYHTVSLCSFLYFHRKS